MRNYLFNLIALSIWIGLFSCNEIEEKGNHKSEVTFEGVTETIKSVRYSIITADCTPSTLPRYSIHIITENSSDLYFTAYNPIAEKLPAGKYAGSDNEKHETFHGSIFTSPDDIDKGYISNIYQGNMEISFNNDTYTIRIEGKDENNKKIKVYYKGTPERYIVDTAG